MYCQFAPTGFLTFALLLGVWKWFSLHQRVAYVNVTTSRLCFCGAKPSVTFSVCKPIQMISDVPSIALPILYIVTSNVQYGYSKSMSLRRW